MCNLINTHTHTHCDPDPRFFPRYLDIFHVLVSIIVHNYIFFGWNDIVVLRKIRPHLPRPSEHPPVMGKKMSKRSGGIKRLQIQNHFMAFKQVPRCR